MFRKRGAIRAGDPLRSNRALTAALVARGDAARDERRWAAAAAFYDEAIRLGGADGPIRVQAGHMFKDAGDLASAELHYQDAAKLMPRDADLALQLGHFYKVAGRLRDAETSYARALELQPGWAVPEAELKALGQSGWAGTGGRPGLRLIGLGRDPEEIARAAAFERLAPEVMPRTAEELLHANGESVHMRRLGQVERTFWGNEPVLRGVQSLRGFCISADPILEFIVLLNGQAIHRGPLRVYPLRNERDDPALRKYVFNEWLDFSRHRPGRYDIEIRFVDAVGTRDPHGGRRSHYQRVVIDEQLPMSPFEGGDAWVAPVDPADPRSVEEQVNARPSTISPARRSVFKAPPKNVLVLRTDQLGDVVASTPALRRLRALLPEANIVCLATGANADLLRTLGVLDEVIVIDFPDEKETQRKRVMTPENQEKLRERLHAYGFDLALDLAPATESRPLLLLSGAKFLAGIRDKVWPYLTLAFDSNTYDQNGRSDMQSASVKTLAFIEALSMTWRSPAEVIRRPELSREQLVQFGIQAHERYVILHTGARVVFSRWGHYPELARRVLDRTDCKVVMLSEDPGTRGTLTPGLLDDPRFQLLDRRLAFDDFDALLSFCACFVGNDSGPKHLASMRGSPVVSLHTPRINWGEWGQEQTGSIIHRAVPCAGCHIYHEPEECGKDYICVTRISVDEVWGAMLPYLEQTGRA